MNRINWDFIGPVCAVTLAAVFANSVADVADYLAWAVLLTLVLGCAFFEFARSRAPKVLTQGGGPAAASGVDAVDATRFGLIVGTVYVMFGLGGIGILHAVFEEALDGTWLAGLSLMLLWLGAVAVVALSCLRDKSAAPKKPEGKPGKPADKPVQLPVVNAFAVSLCGSGGGNDRRAPAPPVMPVVPVEAEVVAEEVFGEGLRAEHSLEAAGAGPQQALGPDDPDPGLPEVADEHLGDGEPALAPARGGRHRRATPPDQHRLDPHRPQKWRGNLEEGK